MLRPLCPSTWLTWVEASNDEYHRRLWEKGQRNVPLSWCWRWLNLSTDLGTEARLRLRWAFSSIHQRASIVKCLSPLYVNSTSKSNAQPKRDHPCRHTFSNRVIISHPHPSCEFYHHMYRPTCHHMMCTQITDRTVLAEMPRLFSCLGMMYCTRQCNCVINTITTYLRNNVLM